MRPVMRVNRSLFDARAAYRKLADPRHSIVGEVNLDGSGSAVVLAKERTTGRTIGTKFFYRKDSAGPPERATFCIPYDERDFPDLQLLTDIAVEFYVLPNPRAATVFPGQLFCIAVPRLEPIPMMHEAHWRAMNEMLIEDMWEQPKTPF